MKRDILNIENIHSLSKKSLTKNLKNFFVNNNLNSNMKEKILYILYYWYGVSSFISFRELKKILGVKFNSKSEEIRYLKKHGCFNVFDEGIYLKTWTRHGSKIVPRNFVRYVNEDINFNIFIHEFNKIMNEEKGKKWAKFISKYFAF
jgi:hypothetical protein